jgi:peptidoglycan L-alanyl-D-glutamate endopeptidase CwlK
MPEFSAFSKRNLETADLQLQELFNEVIKHFDCRVTYGHRGEEEQTAAYHRGNSHVPWPFSKHNKMPSRAVDVIPYPVDWKDLDRFYYFAGVVKGIAAMLGIQITWGGDWDNDTRVKNNKFNDLAHFELVK